MITTNFHQLVDTITPTQKLKNALAISFGGGKADNVPLTNKGYYFGLRSQSVQGQEYDSKLLPQLLKKLNITEEDILSLSNGTCLTEGLEVQGQYKSRPDRFLCLYNDTPCEVQAWKSEEGVKWKLYFTIKVDLHRDRDTILVKLQSERPGFNSIKSRYSILKELLYNSKEINREMAVFFQEEWFTLINNKGREVSLPFTNIA